MVANKCNMFQSARFQLKLPSALDSTKQKYLHLRKDRKSFGS